MTPRLCASLSLRCLLSMLCLLLMACGGLKLPGPPPTAQPVAVTVTVAYAGASPAEVEQALVQPLEQAVMGLAGVQTVRSTAQEGLAVVEVRFSADQDPWGASQAVSERISEINSLPQDAERPVVQTHLPTRLATVALSHSDPTALAAQAEQLKQSLSRIPGVFGVELVGQPILQRSVSLNGPRLVAMGLTVDQVASAILGESVQLPGGVIGGDARALVRVQPELRDLEQLGQVVLNRDGVRLADLATLSSELQSEATQVRWSGESAVAVQLRVATDSVADEAMASVRQALANLQEGELLRAEGRETLEVRGLHGLQVDPVLYQLAQALAPAETLTVRPADPGEPATLQVWGAPTQDLLQLLSAPPPGVSLRWVPPADRQLTVQLSGQDVEALTQLGTTMTRQLLELPGVAWAGKIDGAPLTPQLDIQVDRAKAAQLGLSTHQVASAVRDLHGRELSSSGGEPLVLQVTGLGDPDDPSSLRLPLQTAEGIQLIPLSLIADIRLSVSPPVVTRVDGLPTLSVLVDLATDAPPRAVRAEVQGVLEGLELPPGVLARLAP